MNLPARYILTLLTILFSAMMSQAQEAQFPIISEFGGIHKIPDATELPSSDVQYRVVIDVSKGPAEVDQLNPSLNNIARMLNLHGLGGVPKENIEVIAVMHALATPATISDKDYMKHYGVPNPNTALLKALTTEANVKIFVCGQSLLSRGFADDQLNKNIGKSISALTILTTYQMQGYSLLNF